MVFVNSNSFFSLKRGVPDGSNALNLSDLWPVYKQLYHMSKNTMTLPMSEP